MMKSFGLIFIFALVFVGCVTETQKADANIPKTFFKSTLTSKDLFGFADEYLEWEKGYAVQVKDSSAHFLVTEWVQDSPLERQRVSLSVTRDAAGSLLSTHIMREVFSQSGWKSAPSDERWESRFVSELETYIRSREKTRDAEPSAQKKHF